VPPDHADRSAPGAEPAPTDATDEARLEQAQHDLAVANDCGPTDEPGLPAEEP
jgi:hypothetical protein